MSKKKIKNDIKEQYKFDIEKGEFIERKQFVESKNNPTAIVYVRVSDQKQVEDGNGLESQEATCRRWADSNNIKVVKVFSDKGISGADMNRKGLLDAIEYLKKENSKYKKISHFLCTEISRISRSENIAETEKLKKKIEATGVEIITTHSGSNISSSDINDSLMADISMILAKNERLRIRERSLNGSKAKLFDGYRIFYAPVGYERIYTKNGTKTEKNLQKIEPQASLVKEGLEMFANGVILTNSQLLEFFNKNKLKSNHHSPNPGNLNLTFIKRLFEIERLYFYAGYILYPSYGITKPIEAMHMPLINLSTVRKILKRLDSKGNIKVGVRKDTSDLYPLRGSVYCPYCDYPMTARASRGKMGTLYHYYGCNRKDCNEKENINIDKMHGDFAELLNKIKPKEEVLILLEGVLKEVFKNTNKRQQMLNNAKKQQIKDIDKEIENIQNTLGKLSKIELVQNLEEKWSNLEQKKEILENELQDTALNEKEFLKLYEKIKNIIEDPLSIRDLGSTELKILLVGVLFGGKLYYKKNEGYQTPQISALFNMLDHLKGDKVSYGAGDGTRTRNSLLGRQAL